MRSRQSGVSNVPMQGALCGWLLEAGEPVRDLAQSAAQRCQQAWGMGRSVRERDAFDPREKAHQVGAGFVDLAHDARKPQARTLFGEPPDDGDRKSTRLNSSYIPL